MTSYHQEASYALLRVTLGTIFLTTGIVKFLFGIGNFAAGLQQQFAGKLPMFMVIPFAYALPFLEVTFGAFLLFGLFNSLALIAAGLLLMTLTFGKTAVNDSATVAGNLVYVLINFVLLWLADYNGYSIDRMRQRKAPINRS
jgi:thiosulfate dehydrogenase [quinone] large subunit